MPVAESTPSGSAPEVRAAAGTVRGIREDGVAVFRGIPFAEPPVGALRFAAPRPARALERRARGPLVRSAAAAGRALRHGRAGAGRGGRRLADRQRLVARPEPGAGLPVMVWIQGGGYVIGMSGLPEYDGGRLARDGGVVVVTFNYRVGIEGFAQIEGAPANRGLLDQVAALEWVRDNIRAFGGDPDRVTVFGQSAGGGSVAALLAMDRAAGLFRRAVVQSMPGTFFTPGARRGHRRRLRRRARAPAHGGRPVQRRPRAGCPPPPTRSAPRWTQWAHRWGRPAHRAIPFSPVVDGEVLPVTPWQALADGAGRDIELLVGHTRDEQRLFTAITGLLGEVSEEQAADALQRLRPRPGRRTPLPRRLPGGRPGRALRAGPLRLAVPDAVAPPRRGPGGCRRSGARLRADLAGSGHGRRLRRLPRPRRTAGLRQPRPRPARHAHRRATRPRRRRPCPPGCAPHGRRSPRHGDPGWPAYDTDRRLVQCFDARSAVTAYPEEASRLIWQHHTFAALGLVDR